MHTENPVPLSRTQKSIYAMYQNPITLTQWLISRYTLQESLLGALWLWNTNSVWRCWIQSASKLGRLPTGSQKKKTVRKKIILQNIFSAFKPCSNCGGAPISVHSRADSMKTRLSEIQPPIHQAYSLTSVNCSIEKSQCDILALLFDYGADINEYSNYLIRFAAMMGHASLLRLTLKIIGILKDDAATNLSDLHLVTAAEANAENTNVVPTPAALRLTRDSMRAAPYVLKLLKDSIEAKNVMMTFECIQTGILGVLHANTWERVLVDAFKCGDVNIMSLLIDGGPPPSVDTCLSVIQLLSVYQWFGRDRKQQYSQMARFLLYSIDAVNIDDNSKELLVLRICELGDISMIQFCHGRQWNLQGEMSSNLTAATLHGHYPMAVFLVKEARVNPNIFTSSNKSIFILTTFNFLLLGFAFITSLFALANGIYCDLAFSKAGALQMFGIWVGKDFCYAVDGIANASDKGWIFYIVPTMVFGLVLFILHRAMPLRPMLRGIWLCKREIRLQRRISAAGHNP